MDDKITRGKLHDLIQDDRNLNKGTERGQQLIEKSLREFGAGRSILLDKNNRIIAGNKTHKNAELAGLDDVIIVETDGTKLVAVKRTDVDLDTKKGREMALADNATTKADLSWDTEELNAVAEDFGIDTDEWDVELDEMPADLTEATEDDFDEEQDEIKPVAQRGDVFVLGEHRLMCGDSTSEDDFAKLMNGERADIAFTSPPYNMAVTQMSDKCPNRAMHNGQAYNSYDDNKSDADYTKLLEGALKNCLDHADDVMFNIGILKASKIGIISMMSDFRDKFCDIIVWNKSRSMPLGLPSHAGCVSHRCELIFCFNQDGSRAFSHPQWSHGAQINRIDTENASSNEFAKVHAATFPVALPAKVIESYTEKSVLDVFGGTGTTMIAAEQLGRKCYMMELDEHYCDVIIARWEKLTGRKVVKVDGNNTTQPTWHKNGGRKE